VSYNLAADPTPPAYDLAVTMRATKTAAAAASGGQGLTLVHFSAQPKPFWAHHPVSPCPIDWGKIMHPTCPTKCADVEPKSGRVQGPGGGRRRRLFGTDATAISADDARALDVEACTQRREEGVALGMTLLEIGLFTGRGLHSSTFRLNASTLCGIGGAFRGCLGGVLGVFRECLGDVREDQGLLMVPFGVRNGSG